MKFKWYEDETLIKLSRKCDDLYDSQNENEMQQAVSECCEQANNLENDELVRARYFYVAFTAHGNWINLKIKNEVGNGIESLKNRIKSLKFHEVDFQKSLYLVRNAFELLNNAINGDEKFSKEEMTMLSNFRQQLSVNYANFFYENGRFTKAVEILNIFANEKNFPMGTINLGMKIYEMACQHYDRAQMKVMFYKAFHYIEEANRSEIDFLEKKEIQNLIYSYKNKIISLLGEEYLNKQYNASDFFKIDDNLIEQESSYRDWIAKNRLSLNILNDVFDSIEVGNDPLFLPPMTESIESKKVESLFGLFNQIKQEYVSARFLAYEGFCIREPHFSDRDVHLVNTLDYTIYGLGIEKIKACYRAVYSIFDRIAFFLNEYFELGISEKAVDYVRVFSPDKTKSDKVKILDIADNNYPLFGMWWLFKDIRNINIDIKGKRDRSKEYKHIDNIMSKVSDIRNVMEHRYLKILEYNSKGNFFTENRLDKLAHNISFSDFEVLTLQLLKNVREAVILLVFSIRRAEEIKESSNTDRITVPMYASKYWDDWKQIF